MVERTEYPKFAAYAAYKLIESRSMSTPYLAERVLGFF